MTACSTNQAETLAVPMVMATASREAATAPNAPTILSATYIQAIQATSRASALLRMRRETMEIAAQAATKAKAALTIWPLPVNAVASNATTAAPRSRAATIQRVRRRRTARYLSRRGRPRTSRTRRSSASSILAPTK